jgi:hypothetical protein
VLLLIWLGPSQTGQPKFAPATPSLISSHAPCPTSLTKIRPVPGWIANVKGLRTPSAQIARLAPVAEPKKGLSVGIVPFELIRRILPRRLASVCALLGTAFSPTAT